MNTRTAMVKKGTKKIDIIKNIINYGLNKKDVAITNFKEELGIPNKGVIEWLEIIKYLSDNPVDVKIESRARFTFVTIDERKP